MQTIKRRWKRKRGNRRKPNQANRQRSSRGGQSGESLGIQSEGLGARCLVPSLVSVHARSWVNTGKIT